MQQNIGREGRNRRRTARLRRRRAPIKSGWTEGVVNRANSMYCQAGSIFGEADAWLSTPARLATNQHDKEYGKGGGSGGARTRLARYTRCRLKTEGVCGQWNLSPGCQSIFRGVRTRVSLGLSYPRVPSSPRAYSRLCHLSHMYIRVHRLGEICRTAADVRMTNGQQTLPPSD